MLDYLNSLSLIPFKCMANQHNPRCFSAKWNWWFNSITKLQK